MKIAKLVTKPNLTTMIGTSLVVWATACWALHGPAILYYVGLQAIITGGFVTMMNRTEAAGVRNRQAKANPANQQQVEQPVADSAPAIREESLVGAA